MDVGSSTTKQLEKRLNFQTKFEISAGDGKTCVFRPAAEFYGITTGHIDTEVEVSVLLARGKTCFIYSSRWLPRGPSLSHRYRLFPAYQHWRRGGILERQVVVVLIFTDDATSREPYNEKVLRRVFEYK